MSSDWSEVDALIRELGAVRAASDAARASAAAKAAIEHAIGEATQAVVEVLGGPLDAEAIGQARTAIEVAGAVVAAVDAEVARSRELRAAGAALSARARELLDRCQRAAGTPTDHRSADR